MNPDQTSARNMSLSKSLKNLSALKRLASRPNLSPQDKKSVAKALKAQKAAVHYRRRTQPSQLTSGTEPKVSKP